VVESSPPTSEEATRELMQRLRALRVRKAAEGRASIARKEQIREVRAEMRCQFDRYLTGDITLQTLTRRLRSLEQRIRHGRTEENY